MESSKLEHKLLLPIQLPNRLEVVDDQFAGILRAKSPTERIEMTAEANDMARILIAAGIRHAHPDWPNERILHEVARRMLDAAT